MQQSPFLEVDYQSMVRQAVIVIPVLDIESEALYTKQDARRALSLISKTRALSRYEHQKIRLEIEMSQLPERLTKKASKKILHLSLSQLLRDGIDYEIEGGCWGEFTIYRGSLLN